MSTVKISQLPSQTGFNSNTANTLLLVVDVANSVTNQITLQTLLNRTFENVVSINFNDGSFQSSAPATLQYSQSAFATSNNNSANIVFLQGEMNSANASIANNAANIAYTQNFAQNAYNEANNNLTIINYLGGALNTANANTVSNSANIAYLGGALSTANSNTVYLQGGLNSANANIISLQTYSNAAFSKANAALSNTSGAIFGGNLTISGTLTVKDNVYIQKGFVFTPNVVSNPSTSLTIDFIRDSLVVQNNAGGLTVTLANFVPGKEVILWFTNTSGTNQTVTHGVLANNSTVNATTFTIPGTSTAYLRYFSIDSSLSNTFVAISHA